MIFIEKKKKATDGCEEKKVYRRFDLTQPQEEGEGFGDEVTPQEVSTNGCTPEKRRKKPVKMTKNAEDQGEKSEKEEDPCFSAALRILSAGANSTFMLREKLKKKGFSTGEIELAMEKVAEASLISDRRLMEGYVYSLARRKYYGAYRIRMEILRKFGRDVTDEYFEECLEGIDFKEYALQYAEKNKKLERKALIGRLRQRGYGAEEIRYALSCFTEE